MAVFLAVMREIAMEKYIALPQAKATDLFSVESFAGHWNAALNTHHSAFGITRMHNQAVFSVLGVCIVALQRFSSHSSFVTRYL